MDTEASQGTISRRILHLPLNATTLIGVVLSTRLYCYILRFKFIKVTWRHVAINFGWNLNYYCFYWNILPLGTVDFFICQRLTLNAV